jgi:hypothetical protein
LKTAVAASTAFSAAMPVGSTGLIAIASGQVFREVSAKVSQLGTRCRQRPHGLRKGALHAHAFPTAALAAGAAAFAKEAGASGVITRGPGRQFGALVVVIHGEGDAKEERRQGRREKMQHLKSVREKEKYEREKTKQKDSRSRKTHSLSVILNK